MTRVCAFLLYDGMKTKCDLEFLVEWLRKELQKYYECNSLIRHGSKVEKQSAIRTQMIIKENFYNALFKDNDVFPIIYDGKEDLYVDVDIPDYIKKIEDYLNSHN